MPTLLIAGFGDVARRALPLLLPRWRVLALSRHAGTTPPPGVEFVRADLDRADSLARIGGLADALLYAAPPGDAGRIDLRMRKCLAALAKKGSIPQRIVYISTTGVYGNAAGAWRSETSPCRPETARAQRRMDAETCLRAFARRHGITLTILRAPGIYAADRLPLARLQAALPLLRPEEDGYGNHIHADDLARLCVHALRRRGGIRVYNACDDEPLQTGVWYDLLADHAGYPRVPRMSADEVRQRVTPAQWSFLAESRRLSNRRLREELGFRLDYPSVKDFLARTKPV